MLAVRDRDGSSTGRQAAAVRDGPAAGDAGRRPAGRGAGMRTCGARWCSAWRFLGCALAFLWKRSIGAARRLFLVSVIYLPLLLGLMVFDR